jgi:hypothetical protein
MTVYCLFNRIKDAIFCRQSYRVQAFDDRYSWYMCKSQNLVVNLGRYCTRDHLLVCRMSSLSRAETSMVHARYLRNYQALVHVDTRLYDTPSRVNLYKILMLCLGLQVPIRQDVQSEPFQRKRQMITVPSSEADANCCESGEKASAQTLPVCC